RIALHSFFSFLLVATACSPPLLKCQSVQYPRFGNNPLSGDSMMLTGLRGDQKSASDPNTTSVEKKQATISGSGNKTASASSPPFASLTTEKTFLRNIVFDQKKIW